MPVVHASPEHRPPGDELEDVSFTAQPGEIIGLAGLVLNAWTFPTPPADGELFDIGPFVGLWFAAATIRLTLLLKRSSTPAN